MDEEPTKHPGGRPTKYRPEYCQLATNYCLLRATDKDLAQFLGVVESTIDLWKIEHPEFSESINAGKEVADAEVASALKHRAMGFKCTETKVFVTKVKVREKDEYSIVSEVEKIEITKVDVIKHYPPDTAAAFIWLKNRAGWKDKSEVEQVHRIVVEEVSFDQVIQRDKDRRADGDGIPNS